MRVEGVVADVAGGHTQNGNAGRSGYLTFQAVQVVIDGAGFPAGVGEDRVIDLGKVACGGQGEQGAGLDSGAQGQGAELGLFGDGGSWRAWGAVGVSARRRYGHGRRLGVVSAQRVALCEEAVEQVGGRGNELLRRGPEKYRR